MNNEDEIGEEYEYVPIEEFIERNCDTAEIKRFLNDNTSGDSDFFKSLDNNLEGYTTFDASAKDVIKKSEYTYEELPIKRGDKS